jgi:carbon-monoxide dehydrogenase large subunit
VTSGKYIGAAMRRVEDPRLLVGGGAFVDDLKLPRMLSVAFVRSAHAHARISVVDTAAARVAEGVAAVLTGADVLARVARPMRLELRVPGFQASTLHALSLERARFVGEALAAVAAEDRYLAEDAADRVHVAATPLPAVLDPLEALAPGAPLVHDDVAGNVFFRRAAETGAVDDAFARARVVVGGRFQTGRCTGVPMEGRACLASWERERGRLTVWSSTQIPHTWRTFLSSFLGLAEHRIRVIAPDVGGGFGVKVHIFPEEIVTCLLSLMLARPVKWVEDRRENLLASIHAREHRFDAEGAFAADGTLLALRSKIVCDMGAYSAYPNGAVIEPAMAAQLLPGPYRFAHYRFETYGVATNKCPAGAYRGVARPTATFVRESLLDMAAERLGLSPTDIRLRNLLRPSDFPYSSPAGVVYDSGDYVASLTEALHLAGWDRLHDERAHARRTGRAYGLGIACFVEDTAKGSAYYAERGSSVMPRADSARVRIDPTGSVTVVTAIAPQGQGHETMIAQVVADELGVPFQTITVLHGDTDLGVFGSGTFASRSAVVGAGAATRAAHALRAKVLRIAAHMLGEAEGDLEIVDGVVASRQRPDARVPLADIGARAYLIAGDLPAGIEPGLEATTYYDPPPITFANAVHVAAVEVDRRTGEVDIRKYAVVADCGRAINPLILDGQVHGGVAQGLGNALYEEIQYDAHGQMLTASLMDYLLPTSMEMPTVEVGHLAIPSTRTLGGYRGAGESGTIGAPAAIANAVSDAVGARVYRLPLSPDRVRALVNTAPATR